MDPGLQETAGSSGLRWAWSPCPGPAPAFLPGALTLSLAFPQSDPQPARLSLQPQGRCPRLPGACAPTAAV